MKVLFKIFLIGRKKKRDCIPDFMSHSPEICIMLYQWFLTGVLRPEASADTKNILVPNDLSWILNWEPGNRKWVAICLPSASDAGWSLKIYQYRWGEYKDARINKTLEISFVSWFRKFVCICVWTKGRCFWQTFLWTVGCLAGNLKYL